MTTTVTTITKSAQVFTRTWTDLDPKVRNALIIWVATVGAALTAWLSGRITFLQAVGFAAPVTLAVATAYVTTSKHKDVIRKDVEEAAKVVHDLAPIVKEIAPEAAPVVDEALDAVDAVNAALTTTQILATVPPAPVPATAAGQ